MPTYYLDYANGNDAADGSTFSLVGLPAVGPWKTITSGATAARIAPGDIIKIANNTNKYDDAGALVTDSSNTDPVSVGQSALFTNLSRDVVLAGADLPEDIPRANPTVIHYHTHGMVSGQQVTFAGIEQAGWTALNGVIYNITRTDDDNFTIAVDSTGYAADLGTADPGKCIILPCKEIDNFEGADANWTESANVTDSDDTTQYKLGANSLKVAIAAAFTTGKAAYRDFGAGSEKDLSGYQQISFWFRNSVALAAVGDVKIKLCSDAIGDVPVDTFSLPAIPSTAYWVCLTLDKGAALGNAIRSVSIWMDVDRGALDLNFDNLIACKARSAADALSLQSLISKNSAKQGGTEPWYCIQSISGSTIKIDNHTNQLGNGGRGYTGTTETVALYRRETIKTILTGGLTTAIASTVEAGSDGSKIEYQGGYNTSSGLQDGETFFDGTNGVGIGLSLGHGFLTIDRLNFYKYNYCFANNSVANLTGTIIENIFVGHGTYSFINSGAGAVNLQIDNIIAVNSGNYCISFHRARIGTLRAYGNVGSGVAGIYSSGSVIVDNAIIKNNAGYGILLNYGPMLIKSLTTADNGTGAIGGQYASGELIILASNIDEATIAGALPAGANSIVSFYNLNGTANDHRTYTDGGTIVSETSIRHTASGLAWNLSPTSTNRYSAYPLWVKIAEVAVNADALVTIKAWMRRSHADLTMSLVCRGGQIAGVASDVTASMTAAADTWEEVTITFTPTEAGVVEIEAWAYGGTTYSGYVDDLTATQAA